jgi:hypothetical protein
MNNFTGNMVREPLQPKNGQEVMMYIAIGQAIQAAFERHYTSHYEFYNRQYWLNRKEK